MLGVKEPLEKVAERENVIEASRDAAPMTGERASGSEMVIVMGVVALGAMMVGFLIGLLF